MLPNITYELLKRGYSERDIRKILGENFLRAFAEAERVARGCPGISGCLAVFRAGRKYPDVERRRPSPVAGRRTRRVHPVPLAADPHRTVVGFNAGATSTVVDRINSSTIDTKVNVGDNQACSFIGGAAFSAAG
jgi:hypothetical protein